MKTIQLKKIHAFIVYQNLKRTAPKDFTDMDEMTITVDDILPAFQKASGEFFMNFRKDSEILGNDIGTGKVTKEEYQEKIEALQKKVRKFELEEGEEEIVVEMENAGYNKFVEQYERWGKNWFVDIEDFVKVRKAIKNPVEPKKEKTKEKNEE